MRIAHVAPFFLPVIGGWEEAIHRISVELAPKGFEFTVLTCDELHDRSKIGKRLEIIDGITVKRFPVIARVSSFYRLWPGFTKELKGFDVVHAHNFRHPHVDLCALNKKKYGYKLVLRSGSPFHPKSMALWALRRLYDSAIAGYSFGKTDQLLAYHGFEAARFKAMGFPEEKISVIPFGVGKEFFEPGNAQEFREKHGIGQDFVLNIGRMHHYKNLEVLIRAMVLAPKETDLVLLGGGEKRYVDSLKKLARELGLMDRTHFVPATRDKTELRGALAACELFVLPSVYEPFGMVVLEAMAQAKAVIATCFDGPSAVIDEGETGMLFRPDSVGQLSEKINYLLSNKSVCKKIGLRARQKAMDYTWDKIAAMVEKVYRGLC